MSLAELNPRLRGFACLRCGEPQPIADYSEGCPACLARGYPASVVPRFDSLPPLAEAGTGRGLRRFAERLPYRRFPSLGEGDTPLLPLGRLAAELGLDALHLKYEGANPSGSHKDRMSAQFVARALDIGAPGVVAASSGNAGLSLAVYAAAAGISCLVVMTEGTGTAYREALERAGARVHTEPDSLARWRHVAELVRREGWLSATNYLDPPVGSHPFGVDGYKTLGYELAENPAAAADVVIVPTARGDVLWGLHLGLAEQLGEGLIDRLPRLVAVEPFPRLSRVLAGEDYRAKFAGSSPLAAINGATVTYQAVTALARSKGTAIEVDPQQAWRDQARLAADDVRLELSSAAALSALRLLLANADFPIRRAVLIGTAKGR
jgi:threonine synthase